MIFRGQERRAQRRVADVAARHLVTPGEAAEIDRPVDGKLRRQVHAPQPFAVRRVGKRQREMAGQPAVDELAVAAQVRDLPGNDQHRPQIAAVGPRGEQLAPRRHADPIAGLAHRADLLRKSGHDGGGDLAGPGIEPIICQEPRTLRIGDQLHARPPPGGDLPARAGLAVQDPGDKRAGSARVVVLIVARTRR